MSCLFECFTNRYTRETTEQIVFPNEMPGIAISSRLHFGDKDINWSIPQENYGGTAARIKDTYSKKLGFQKESQSDAAEYQQKKVVASLKDVEILVNGGFNTPVTRTIRERIEIPVNGCGNFLKRIFCCGFA